MRKVRQIGQALRGRDVPRLAIVAPCYNEEDVLSYTFASLRSLLLDLRKDVFNHADFRLLSRDALTILREFRENNLFLRGLMPLRAVAAIGAVISVGSLAFP